MEHASIKRPTRVAKFGHLSVDPERFSAFLTAEHPIKTAESAAAKTGMSIAAARKALERGGGCSYPTFIRCIGAYGPRFLLAVFPPELVPDWIAQAARAQERAALEADMAAIAARLERIA